MGKAGRRVGCSSQPLDPFCNIIHDNCCHVGVPSARPCQVVQCLLLHVRQAIVEEAAGLIAAETPVRVANPIVAPPTGRKPMVDVLVVLGCPIR